MALYVVGSKSWHENLFNTINENHYETWLQYNVDIQKLYKNEFREQLRKYKHFFVYGHTKGDDYKFRNPIEYRHIPDQIGYTKNRICINRSCDEINEELKLPNRTNGAHVSVIYVIYIDENKSPRLSNEKQPPPLRGPTFEKYDITDGKCSQLSHQDCGSIKCKHRTSCNWKDHRCYYEYGYETWLPVKEIINIVPPVHFEQFRYRGRQITVEDLKYKRIFPVGLLRQHKDLLESHGYR